MSNPFVVVALADQQAGYLDRCGTYVLVNPELGYLVPSTSLGRTWQRCSRCLGPRGLDLPACVPCRRVRDVPRNFPMDRRHTMGIVSIETMLFGLVGARTAAFPIAPFAIAWLSRFVSCLHRSVFKACTS